MVPVNFCRASVNAQKLCRVLFLSKEQQPQKKRGSKRFKLNFTNNFFIIFSSTISSALVVNHQSPNLFFLSPRFVPHFERINQLAKSKRRYKTDNRTEEINKISLLLLLLTFKTNGMLKSGWRQQPCKWIWEWADFCHFKPSSQLLLTLTTNV